MNIAEYSIRHRVISSLFATILLVGGLLSFFRLGQLEDPEFTLKTAMLVTAYPGASPEQVEEEVTLPLEMALQNLPYVHFITSISSSGLSQIQVEMKPTYRAAKLKQIWDEMRHKVADMQHSLPPGVGQVQVLDDFGDVFGIMLAITGQGYDFEELQHYADLLRRELVLLDGIGKVDIGGQQSQQVFVELSRSRLSALGISPQRIFSLLDTQNTVAYAGRVRVGDKLIRVSPTGEFASVEDMGNLLISEPGDPRLVYLRDVADIHKGYADIPDHLYRYNGEAALVMGISFASGVNVVDVGQSVEQMLASLDYKRPAGMTLNTVYNQPHEVSTSVNDFLLNLGQAVAIVIAVLLVFMGLRSGLLMGGVLLLTILGTFIAMRVMGIELQRISLGALIIALGMLVDNAIVITEGILVNMKRGYSKLKSAKLIVKQTMWPLLGATVIAITAFAPIGLSEDASGEYTNTLFWVLLISLLLSWITAITLVPFFADLVFRPQPAAENEEDRDPYAGRLFTLYRRILHTTIRHRVLTLSAMVLLLVASVIGFGQVKQAFFPPSNTPMFLVDYWLPQGSDIRATEEQVARLEQSLLAMDHVNHVTSTVGRGAKRFMLPYVPELSYPSYAQLIVSVEAREHINSVLEKTRHVLVEEHPQAFAKVKRLMIGPAPSASIEARFSGPDPEVLRQLGHDAQTIMASDAALESIRHNWREKEMVIRPVFLEAQARRTGISRSDLDDALAYSLSGQQVGIYRDGSDLLPIIARPPDDERLSVERINDIQIWSSAANGYVPINQVVSGFDTQWEDALIMRRDRKRTLTVQAEPNVMGDETPDQALRRIRGQVEALPLPVGYSLEWGGEFEASADAQEAVFKSVPMGYLFMFIITIFLFNTLRQPLVIWATVPLAIIGVSSGLLLMNAPFGFMALLGFLSLSGMLVKNGIVLVEQIKLELEMGLAPLDAVVHASVTRVRPVCMAAITTVLGMVPLLFDAFFESMAVVIMFGLGFATVLTLIVIPVLYTLLYRIPPRTVATA